ncbi:MAG: hypothetical protein ACTSR3_06485 [Candidatus Helarchaeota archaeon]
MNIMIDTQIWIYSKKIPKKELYQSKKEFQKALESHGKAKTFFKNLPKKTIIFFTIHQLGELYHSLSFRGLKIPYEQTKKFIEQLFNSKNIKIIPYSINDIKKAIELSAIAKIHIWDFLCVLPLKNHISMIYTNDIHFKDKIFRDLGFQSENPLDIWQKL